jgi:hypothetical protein
MGMQVHFVKGDLPREATVAVTSHGCLISVQGDTLSCYGDGTEFWFDCGSRSFNQMQSIALLIYWRVPFQAY